jgi:glucose-6-phosphate 1-epimerase
MSLPSCEGARWEVGPGDLPVLVVRTDCCEARMFRHGAHVAAWTPTGHQPGLHLAGKSVFAPGKAIRGGIPICYPWFGERTADPKPGGTPSPAHGFARTRPWHVDDVRRERETGRILAAMSFAPAAGATVRAGRALRPRATSLPLPRTLCPTPRLGSGPHPSAR